MKKAICVVAHDNYSYNVRIKYLEQILKNRGYEVVIVSSDFDHRTKKRHNYSRDGLVLLPGKPYKKNLSFARVLSHKDFAEKSLEYLKKEKPDFVFASGAPNLIYKYISKYKSINKHARVIFDVTDMWPETFPVSGVLEKCLLVPFFFWKSIRVKYLPKADYCLFECELFERIVRKDNKDILGNVVYLCENDVDFTFETNNSIGISLLYLGSLNNILDIDLIEKLVEKLSKYTSVEVNIVGDGEKREEFCKRMENGGAKVKFHGVIYDEKSKADIFRNCQFSLNIMKNSVCVGATMKCIEYFRAGLPVINNIPADTAGFINDYECGYNLDEKSLDNVVKALVSIDKSEISRMSSNSRRVYDENFSPKVFEERITKILNSLEGI